MTATAHNTAVWTVECYNNKRDGRCSDVNAKSKQRFNQIYIRYFVIYVNKIYKIQINSTTTLYP